MTCSRPNPWTGGRRRRSRRPFRDQVGVPWLCAPGNASYAGCNAHAPDENIRLADLPCAIDVTIYLLRALGQAA
jgi:hypothetical protein